MTSLRVWLVGPTLLVPALLLLAQDYSPPPPNAPDAATRKAIAEKTAKLEKSLDYLRKQAVRDPVLAEIEVCHKAAVWITRHNEFYHKDASAWTLEALDLGLLRASQAAQGETPWLRLAGQTVVRAYRSQVDGSVQPYAVTFPAEYAKQPRKPWRLDVVLHGRDSSLTEAKFLHQHNGTAAPKDQDFIRLDIFGRVNNAYRWAGEADVFEAIEAFWAVERLFGRGQPLDPTPVLLRGFSMGGAGTWHLGLHHPGRWAVLGPGAGFTTTHGYIKGLPDPLPPYQEACLHIYDAVDYAENAFNVPVVSYGGDLDPQLQASRNIEERLKPLGIPMTLIIAPGLAHQFPPEWQKKAQAEYAKHVARGRKEYPDKVRFVTYTLKYPTCHWVELLALDRHYARARVEAEKTESGYTVKTENVQGLRLALPDFSARDFVLRIDGQDLPVKPVEGALGKTNVYLEKEQGRWRTTLWQKLAVDQFRRPRKAHNLQGPIDDAFMAGFLCVRGTGKPWHDATQRYAEANLKRFQDEWSKFLRGDLPVKDDTEVTDEDISTKHLVLFGDPSSNSLLAQVVDRLPLQWTKDRIILGGKTYGASEHVPVLIFPSPLFTGRYVVVNSGHTFHAAEFKGTNAQLYPRLGDYAVLKLEATEKDPLAATTAVAGLFDEHWQVRE